MSKFTTMDTYGFLLCVSAWLCSHGLAGCQGIQDHGSPIRVIAGVRFLLTVNDTWADPPGCITTVATEMIPPGHKSSNIMVGACDNGPLEYRITSPGKDNNIYTLSLIFHSSVIVDASPPTCDLSWNGTYLVPSRPWQPDQDLLPACFTMDSREGYHMTSYWFHILEWVYK